MENVPETALKRIRELADQAERVVSICTGAYLLGLVGVLDERRVTTHWSLCDTLAERFPSTTVAADQLYVRDGKVSTSAGVTAGIDLALALVAEDLGSDNARFVAQQLLVFLHRPGNQEQFSVAPPAHPAERHPVRELQQWVQRNLDQDLSVEALARRIALSPRQFARVFLEETGVTPGRFVERTRLDAARRRLETTFDSIDKVAQDVGYGSAEAMRRAFMRHMCVPPGAYRRHFRALAVPCNG